MSWPSDLIEPVVALGSTSEIWVGVDQRVACISADGRVVVSLGLGTRLLDIRCFSTAVVVLCETEAVVFNADGSLRAVRGSPDLPCDVLEDGGALVVTFDDGVR